MNRIITVILFFIAFVSVSVPLKAQLRDDDLVQFSGVVVTADSLRPIPFTHITSNKSRQNITADYFGFFSFVARKGETVRFNSIGYKPASFRIPDTLAERRYSWYQVMSSDTIMLTETVIFPWPSREQFKEAFIKMKIPDDDYEITRKNLALMERRSANRKNYDPDRDGFNAEQNYRNYVDTYTNKLYYNGQVMPNNLLNPLAWAKFIKAWKNGDFKRKD
jgi:hypothetical protein